MGGSSSTPLTPEDLAGVLLSGGNSRRMGKDKAELIWEDKTLLQHSADRLAALCGERLIISNHESHTVPGLPRFSDLYPDTGPLGGILTAFAHTDRPFLLVTAVDIPLVSLPYLVYLCKVPTTDTFLRLPRERNRFQPLCAIYSREGLPLLEAAHNQGNYRLLGVLENIPREIVELTGNEDFYFPEIFHNVNHPEDWKAIGKL